jgi:hypothetical protein
MRLILMPPSLNYLTPRDNGTVVVTEHLGGEVGFSAAARFALLSK